MGRRPHCELCYEKENYPNPPCDICIYLNEEEIDDLQLQECALNYIQRGGEV